MSEAAFTVAWTGPAQRALRKLPEKAAAAAVEFIYGPIGRPITVIYGHSRTRGRATDLHQRSSAPPDLEPSELVTQVRFPSSALAPGFRGATVLLARPTGWVCVPFAPGP